MKYQIGEVVRFSGTNNEWGEQFAIITASKMQGEDVFGVYNGPLYRTSISDDWWIREQWLEPVNGGMPKHRYNFLSDEEKMYDFLRLSKDEFLASYSYLTEEEYDATTQAYSALSKVLQDWTEEYKTESTSESVALSLCDAAKRLNDDDLELLYLEVEKEKLYRDEQQQRILAGAIVSAMDAYLQKFGDDHDFCCSGYGDIITLSMMHDAIVNEFDLSAS